MQVVRQQVRQVGAEQVQAVHVVQVRIAPTLHGVHRLSNLDAHLRKRELGGVGRGLPGRREYR